MKLVLKDQNGNLLHASSITPATGDIKIGRTDSCQIRLNSLNISREHLLVRCDAQGQVLIQDLHSTFGTPINGMKIQPGIFLPFQPGSVAQLSQDVFLFLEAGPEIGMTGIADLKSPAGGTSDPPVFPFFLSRNENLVRETFHDLRLRLPAEIQSEVDSTEAIIKSRMRELSAVLEVSFALSSITNFQRLLEYTIDMALQVTGAERGGLILFNEQRQMFEMAVLRRLGTGEIEQDMKTSGSLIRRCFQTGETMVIRDTSTDPSVAGNQSIVLNKILSLAVTPLKIQSVIIGVLYLDNRLSANTFTDRVQELLRVFAAQASLAIHNSRLLYLATTDGLTGLLNHKHFLNRLLEEFYRVRRHGSTLSLLMLDIDHFKNFNDTYGHLVGDKVLRHVAQLLRDKLRIHDLAARYGGEEFSILLPQTDLSGASHLADKLLSTISANPLIHEGKQLGVTISIGAAEFDPKGMDRPLVLVKAADAALYEAKKRGRNQVRLYPIV